MPRYKATKSYGIGIDEIIDEFVDRVHSETESRKRILGRSHTSVEGVTYLPSDWQDMGEVVVSIYFKAEKQQNKLNPLSLAAISLLETGYSPPMIL